MRMTRGAAYQAGLRPGDVILSVNGRPVTDAAAFMREIADAAVGSTITLEVLRDARAPDLARAGAAGSAATRRALNAPRPPYRARPRTIGHPAPAGTGRFPAASNSAAPGPRPFSV